MWKAVALLVVLAFALSGAGVAYYYAKNRNPPLDKTSLCPKDDPPPEITAILIDATDPILPSHQTTIFAELENVQLGVPRHGALYIYTVSGTPAGSYKPAFNKCSPGGPEDTNKFFESPRRARERWEEFKTTLEDILEKSLESTGASNSPIIESLQAVAAQAFSSNQLDDVPKKLIIVSDMLQNTSLLNHYQQNFDYETFRRRSRGAGSPLGHLADVQVTVHYLTRPGTPQGDKNIVFWKDYFLHQGADIDLNKNSPHYWLKEH